MTSPSHLTALQQAAADLEAAGAIACEDYFVHFVTQGMVSADYYGLRPTDDGRLEVYYAERGERRALETTSDTARARAVFTAKVLDLARMRGHGSLA